MSNKIPDACLHGPASHVGDRCQMIIVAMDVHTALLPVVSSPLYETAIMLLLT